MQFCVVAVSNILTRVGQDQNWVRKWLYVISGRYREKIPQLLQVSK